MKTLKIFGKVVAWFFIVVFGIAALLSVVTLCWGGVQRGRGKVMEALPSAPSDFVPTVRLIAFTDSHNMNDRVADAMDTACALFNDDPVYAGADGIFGPGDFSSVRDEGGVRIRGYDLNADVFFCDYFIENVNDPDTFAYTYKNMKARDAAPVFREDARVAAYENEADE